MAAEQVPGQSLTVAFGSTSAVSVDHRDGVLALLRASAKEAFDLGTSPEVEWETGGLSETLILAVTLAAIGTDCLVLLAHVHRLWLEKRAVSEQALFISLLRDSRKDLKCILKRQDEILAWMKEQGLSRTDIVRETVRALATDVAGRFGLDRDIKVSDRKGEGQS